MTTSTMTSVQRTELAPPRRVATADHPGRWVGGAIGALMSLVAAVVAVRLEGAQDGFFLDWSQTGLLGIPIGFVLGRQLMPLARSEGWRRAVGVGMLFGWAAPPLGAIEILAGSRLLDSNLSSTIAGPVALVLLPVAIPLSFLAIFMTIPVGLAWGLVLRLVPSAALEGLRVPAPLERFGARHAISAATIALLAVELAART
jgi:hypothetical protein